MPITITAYTAHNARINVRDFSNFSANMVNLVDTNVGKVDTLRYSRTNVCAKYVTIAAPKDKETAFVYGSTSYSAGVLSVMYTIVLMV